MLIMGLSSSQVFFDEDDFYEKVDAVLNGNEEDVTELRNRLLKEKNPFTEWSGIFKQLGLKKVSDKLIKKSKAVSDALHF